MHLKIGTIMTNIHILQIVYCCKNGKKESSMIDKKKTIYLVKIFIKKKSFEVSFKRAKTSIYS